MAVGASHAFHVFVVYPWVGLLGTQGSGRSGGSGGDVARSVLDQCRIRWGTVQTVTGDEAIVSCSPLTWDGIRLDLGGEQPQVCQWTRDRHAFVDDLRPGDSVALHWDWVCQRLSPAERSGLICSTQLQLGATNRWLSRSGVRI